MKNQHHSSEINLGIHVFLNIRKNADKSTRSS
jgi:hypothetical protein